MKKKIKVLIVEPEKEPYEKIVDNTLESLQQIVYGDIEDTEIEKGVYLISNRNGKLEGLAFNRYVEGDMFAGTFIVASAKKGKIISMPKAMIEKYKDYFELDKHKYIVEMFKSKYSSSSELADCGFVGGY